MAENENNVFFDSLFRDKKGRIVDPPLIQGLVADTHAHLDMLDNPELAIARCVAHNVMLICTVVDPTENAMHTYDTLAEWIAGAFSLLDSWGTHQPLPTCRVIAGVHPHNASKWNQEALDITVACAKHPATVAIGEIGLDYHYDISPREEQRDVFKRQINLAHELDMPIVLHIREAHDDALKILEREGVPAKGALLHCFTSDSETLKPFLDLDCYVAFGGALTFNNSNEIREASLLVPDNRLLTETDCPFMAPMPMRSTNSSPYHTIFVADYLAKLRGIPEEGREEFFSTLFKNALDFFDIEFL